jgi:hypothetical protein
MAWVGGLAVVIMAGTSAYGAWLSTEQGKKADEAAKKAEAQAKIDRENALKAQADYKLISEIGIVISVIGLIVTAYMIFRRPS